MGNFTFSPEEINHLEPLIYMENEPVSFFESVKFWWDIHKPTIFKRESELFSEVPDWLDFNPDDEDIII